MDHVVYLDARAKELDLLLSGSKTMILRGATGRKLPYGRVQPRDVLYFINNNGEGCVRARAVVTAVTNSPALSPAESQDMVIRAQEELQFTPEQFKRWAGKRYLVLIQVGQVTALEPFAIDRSAYGNMDDWLPVIRIETVRA